MARHSRHREEELPFVALMDTMTNVVGVLIIVLVMIGIGLARSVQKVLSELPPVTVEEHVKLQKKVEASTPKNDPQQVEAEIAKLQETLKKAVEDLKTMDAAAQKQDIKIINIEEITKKLAELKKERDARKSSVEKYLADIDKLKAQLDATPVYVPPPAIAIKLPNPRPMPDNAVVQHFLLAGERIVYTNYDEYGKLVEQELKNNDASLSLSHEIVKGADGKPITHQDKFGRVTPQRKVVYDPQKIASHFARARLTGRNISLSGRDINIEVIPAATSPTIPIKLTVAPGAGETIAQAKILTSEFQTLLRKFKEDPQTVIWFHVYKDSIATYFAARELADQARMPVGWDLDGSLIIFRYLPPEHVVKYTPPPPAPTPAPSSVPTPPPVKIAPPKATLD